MASELSKLMRQYGVTSASMALPPQFKETAPTAPTAPLAPVKPADFTDTAPDYISYGLTKSQAGNIKAAPTALDKKEQVGADLKTIQDNWTAYQKDLASFNANKAANKQAMDSYNAYVKPDPKFTDKNTYDYQNNQYQLANQKYQSALNTYDTNKTAFDTGKGGAYKAYKDAYQDRIMQTPMYLREQFTRGVTENPYKNLYSPYGSIDTYNKVGTFWDSPIGEPDYKNNAAYSPYDNTKTTVSSSWLDDTLNDSLPGGNKVDTLVSGDNNDVIVDTLPGGDVNDSLVGGDNNDVIVDNSNAWWFLAGYPDLDTAMMKTGLNKDGRIDNPDPITLTKDDSVLLPNNPWWKEKFLSPQQAVDMGVVPASVFTQQELTNPYNLPLNTTSINLTNPNQVNLTKDTSGSSLEDLAIKNGVATSISNATPVDKTTLSLISQPSVTQQAAAPSWLPKFSKGGSVHHLARKYADGGGINIADSAMPNPEQGIPQPIEAPAPVVAPQIQPSDSMAQMQEMLKAYATPSNDYAQELEEARRKSNAETEAFMRMIQKSKKPENDNLSQAELYFRLAAAAGAPTKTGSFTESLSNINKEMADYSKDQTGRRNADLELQMKAQQLKAANAKEDLNVLRGLAGESMKDKRALISEMIKAEIPKAQSEAGKLALDMGLKVGTPDYQKFVTNNGMQLLQAKINQMIMGPAIASQNAATSGTQANIAQERYNLENIKYQDKQEEGKKLTANDRKVLWEKEDTLNNLKNAQKMIEQAYDLNGVAYTGNVFDIAQQKYGEVFSPEDPTVVNTGKLINLLSTESLSRMKDVFGSNPTEGERAAQAQLSGALAKSKEVRKDIMLNYMEQLQKRIALEEKRLKQLNEGTSRDLPSKEEAQ